MAHRLTTPFLQHRTNTGAINSGGTVTFYEAGTETLATVYTDPALSDEAENPIELDSAGYADTEVWSDETLDVVLKNSLGVVQKSVDDVQAPSSEDFALPDGDDGQILQRVGVTWEAVDFYPLPDETGATGQYLKSVGENGSAVWADLPAAEEYDADNLPGGIEDNGGTSGNIVIGNTMIQWGTDTCPTVSDLDSTKAVTFGTPFSDTPYAIVVTAKAIGVTSNSPSGSPSMQAISHTATGFTANAFVGEENTGGTDEINSAVPFTYIAIGPA